eukprot:121940_1
MFGITFGKKPIKENIKPTIYDYMVKYRVIIIIIFTFIIAIIIYMNPSTDTSQSNEMSIVNLSEIKLTVPKEIIHQTAIAQQVNRDHLLH